jgi:murein DD-endopeptidase MepM/ murein hydrolase activator NlpD
MAIVLALVASFGTVASAGPDGSAVHASVPSHDGATDVLHGLGSLGVLGKSKHRHRTGLFAFCPVRGGGLHFMDDFGQPRYAGGFHYHQGVDMFAARGTPIVAPFDGTAVGGSNWAGGLSVTLTGRNGFVYNAHLTALGRLGKVRAGTVIGYVGNTGDAQGGSTHDHFEWHPRGGPAVDGYPLLAKACPKARHP